LRNNGFYANIQWFHDNTALVNNAAVSGVNTSSLSLSDIQAIDGEVIGFMSDSAGGIFSDSAIIVVKISSGFSKC